MDKLFKPDTSQKKIYRQTHEKIFSHCGNSN